MLLLRDVFRKRTQSHNPFDFQLFSKCVNKCAKVRKNITNWCKLKAIFIYHIIVFI